MSVHARDIHHSGQLQGRRIGLAADNELVFQGGQAQAETAFNAQARNIRIGSTTQTSGDGHNGNTVLDREAGISVTGKGGTLGLYAQNDLHLDAATLSNAAADGTTRLVAGNQLQMGTVRTEHHEAYGSLADKNHRHIHQTQEIGSVIDTAGNVQLAAGGDIRIRQGDIHSSNGQIALRAGRDITLSEGRQTTELDAAVYLKSRGILSSTKNTDQYRFQHDEAVGSRLSGANVTMQAAGDIRLQGSHTASQNETVLNAGGDIRLEAAQNHYTDHEYHEERKSGLMGSGGLGFTIGQRKTTDNDDGTSLIHSGSSVTSKGGDIRITAGGHYRQSGSDIDAGGDADVHARSIDVSAVNDRYSNQHIHTYQQKGLTVSLDIGPLQAAQNLYQSARTIGQSRHGRTNAMAAANTGWQAYQLIDGYKGGRLLDTSNLSLSVGYGQQKNRSEVRSDLSRVQESSINAGGKTRLHATGAGQASNITVTGSDIQGAGGTLLAADNRILLQSATFGQNEESRHQSSGWNVGVTARYDGTTNIGISAGGQTGHGNGHGAGESHRHSHIGNKDSQTILQSGGDTTLRGAQVAGKGIRADVQNLSIESVQDTAAYQGRQKSGGAQISAGYGGVGINGHYSQSQLDADHRSVSEQSGLYAGDDGYQIHVRAHTELNGGLITSSQSAEDNGKNHFSTGTLGFGDLHNHSHYQGESLGMDAGVSRSNKTQGQKSDAQPDDKNRLSNTAGKNGTSHGIGYGSDSDRQESITRSGINTRNLQITDEAGQIRQTGLTAEETRAKVSTDTTTESAQADAGSLHNRFDKEQVQRELDTQTEVTQTFSHTRQQIWSVAATKAQAHRERAENLARSADIAEKNGDHATAARLRKEAESERQQAKRWQWTGVAVNMVGAGLSAPTQSSAGIAANAAAPAVSYRIGQEFKRRNAEGSLGHLLAHATLGGLTAAAGGNDPLAGALSSGGAEAAAGYISRLFGQTDGSRLSAEQKETVTAIAGLIGTAAGAALGNTPADAAQGSLNARNSVENNWLSIEEIQEFQQQYKRLPEDEQEREAALEKLFEETAQKSQANRENTAQNCQNPNSAACLNDKEKMTAGWNYVMDANRYLGYEKSIQSNQATEQSSQHKQDNPPASGGTELVNVLVMGKRPPYQERKDVRFFEYENLRDIADFAADDEQRQAIDEYLGSKNYQYTNQPWYAKPYMRMYALPALQATMGVGQAAAGVGACLTGAGCITGGVLVVGGVDDAYNGWQNLGVEPAKQVPTLRVQGLQALGLSRMSAERTATIVDMAAGGVGLLKHYSANIGKTVETVGADQVGHLNHATGDALAGNNTAARTMSPVDGEMAGVNRPIKRTQLPAHDASSRTSFVVATDKNIAVPRSNNGKIYVFRGDGRKPNEIFDYGFTANGTNRDLLNHAETNINSAYISTSMTPNIAREFTEHSNGGYVYTINKPNTAIDVNKTLGGKSPKPYEQEMAIPDKINFDDIKGARQVDEETQKFIGPFIVNPNYKGK